MAQAQPDRAAATLKVKRMYQVANPHIIGFVVGVAPPRVEVKKTTASICRYLTAVLVTNGLRVCLVT